MTTVGAQVWRVVGGVAVVALVLIAAGGVATAGERRAGSVVAVDPGGRGLLLDEMGVAAVRRTIEIKLAPDAAVLISERVEPVTNFYRTFTDTAITLADIRPGDFVIVDVGEQPGVAERVVVTHRKPGS